MKNVIKWLDDHVLEIYTGLLIVFIPLYPKLPLFDAIPGYIVRVRFEDFLILFAIFLWVIYLLRRKISLNPNPLLKPIVIYLIIGFISVISAVYLTKTIPNEFIHISKSMLHFFRRVEYFSLFFILFSVSWIMSLSAILPSLIFCDSLMNDRSYFFSQDNFFDIANSCQIKDYNG